MDFPPYLNPPVEMNTNVGPHVLGTDAQHLVRLHALGVGPLGDHVVQDPLSQVAGNLIENHELPHPVQHLVVLGRGESHVVDDCCHVTKDGSIKKTRHDHHAQGKRLLRVCIGSHISKSNGGHASHREVQSCHVH